MVDLQQSVRFDAGVPGGRSQPKRPSRRPAADADDRRRQPRGEERRQQILDAAVELFAEKGYRGSDIAMLAARVGMTAPGLLYYFGSKERLLFEVVEERHRQRQIDPAQPMTLKELRDHARFNAEHPTLTRMYFVLAAESLDPEAPLHDFFVERTEGARAYLRAVLRRSIADGQIRKDIDIHQLATEIHATGIGLEAQWLADPKRVDLATALEAYLDRLLAQLAPD